MKKKVQVKTFVEYWYCDTCKYEIRPNGTVLTVNPPIYVHQCINEKCTNVDDMNVRKTFHSRERYPLTTYEKASKWS